MAFRFRVFVMMEDQIKIVARNNGEIQKFIDNHSDNMCLTSAKWVWHILQGWSYRIKHRYLAYIIQYKGEKRDKSFYRCIVLFNYR